MNYKITIFVPLESIGVVKCDYKGLCHIQINDEEFVTDEATYWRINNARSRLNNRLKNKKEN